METHSSKPVPSENICLAENNISSAGSLPIPTPLTDPLPPSLSPLPTRERNTLAAEYQSDLNHMIGDVDQPKQVETRSDPKN